MISYNSLSQPSIHPFQMYLILSKQKKIKIKLSLILKIAFFKFFMQDKQFLKKKIIGDKQTLINQNYVYTNSNLKKVLKNVLNDSILPISNTFFFIKKLLKKVSLYYKAILKKKKILRKFRRYFKKTLTLRKRTLIRLAKTFFKLKQFLLIIKSLNASFNVKNLIKTNLFLFLKNKIFTKLKKEHFATFFIKNNTNYYKFAFLIRILKNKKGNRKSSLSKINLFYKKFVGLFTKKGEKRKSLKIINNALLTTSKSTNLPINKILRKLHNKLSTSVEIKKIKIRRSFHFIPFPVNAKRKLYLIIKWFIFAMSTFKSKTNLEYKLNDEILKVLKNQESIVNYSKKYQIQKSFKYQSNTNFRW